MAAMTTAPRSHDFSTGGAGDESQPPELLLIPDEVSAILGVTRLDLERMRQTGSGPAYLTIGHTIRYLSVDVHAWRTNRPKAPEASGPHASEGS